MRDEARVDQAVVRRQRLGTAGASRERVEGGPGGEDPRLHGVVNALERRDVDEARRIAHEQQSLAVALVGQRVEAALGDRFRTPLQQLTTLEMRAEKGMQLHPLEQLVHVERCVVIVEADDEPDGNLSRPQGVHEAAAKRVRRERPAQRVDYAIQGPLHIPHFLHAEREDLGIRRAHVSPLAPGLRQHPTRPLGEDRDLRSDVGRLLIPGARLAAAIEAGCGGANAPHGLTLDQERRDGESRKEVDARLLRLFSEPAHDLAD